MSHDRWLRRARICGIAPLIAASVVSVGFAATRANFWIWAAIVTILVGFIAVAIGLVFVALYAWPLATSPATESADSGPTVRRALLTTALLLANLPAAAAFGYGGILLATRYTVSLANESDRVVDTFVVTGGGVQLELGPLRPGERHRGGFWIKGDTTLRFEGTVAGSRVCGIIDGYVSGGGDAAARIGRDGSILVEHRGRGAAERAWPHADPCP